MSLAQFKPWVSSEYKQMHRKKRKQVMKTLQTKHSPVVVMGGVSFSQIRYDVGGHLSFVLACRYVNLRWTFWLSSSSKCEHASPPIAVIMCQRLTFSVQLTTWCHRENDVKNNA